MKFSKEYVLVDREDYDRLHLKLDTPHTTKSQASSILHNPFLNDLQKVVQYGQKMITGRQDHQKANATKSTRIDPSPVITPHPSLNSSAATHSAPINSYQTDSSPQPTLNAPSLSRTNATQLSTPSTTLANVINDNRDSDVLSTSGDGEGDEEHFPSTIHPSYSNALMTPLSNPEQSIFETPTKSPKHSTRTLRSNSLLNHENAAVSALLKSWIRNGLEFNDRNSSVRAGKMSVSRNELENLLLDQLSSRRTKRRGTKQLSDKFFRAVRNLNIYNRRSQAFASQKGTGGARLLPLLRWNPY